MANKSNYESKTPSIVPHTRDNILTRHFKWMNSFTVRALKVNTLLILKKRKWLNNLRGPKSYICFEKMWTSFFKFGLTDWSACTKIRLPCQVIKLLWMILALECESLWYVYLFRRWVGYLYITSRLLWIVWIGPDCEWKPSRFISVHRSDMGPCSHKTLNDYEGS
jgi:hypothetical protein